MKAQLEFAGSNVEKAAKAASKKLSIPREKLQYRVLSYGATGIFGLVRTKKARIEVVLPAGAQKGKEAPVEPKRRERKAKVKKEKRTKAAPRADEVTTAAPAPGGRQVNREASEESKALGLTVLERIAQLISKDAKVSAREDSDGLLFEIESPDAAVLIGKRGQTLEAIQYLTEKIINKHSEGRVHVQVDIEGYLKKRRDSLEGLASRMTEKALRTGKPATIGQMSAYERKIVHLKLKDDSRVRTQSKGDGFLRKLVIFPVRNPKDEGKNKREAAPPQEQQ